MWIISQRTTCLLLRLFCLQTSAFGSSTSDSVCSSCRPWQFCQSFIPNVLVCTASIEQKLAHVLLQAAPPTLYVNIIWHGYNHMTGLVLLSLSMTLLFIGQNMDGQVLSTLHLTHLIFLSSKSCFTIMIFIVLLPRPRYTVFIFTQTWWEIFE